MLISILPAVSFFIWFTAVFAMIFGTAVSLFHFRNKNKPITENFRDEELDPITILKPLKGVDEGLRENLESFFQAEYPQYEIIFSVADETDAVIPIVKSLFAQYPSVRAELIIGAVNFGPNPKINNLLRGYEKASFDWILISDSNTRIGKTQLKELAQQFKGGVAMQTSIVAGVSGEGIGGDLESAFLNTFYARSVLALSKLGHPCVIGKAMLFRKSILDRTGGLKSLKKHIAEDYAAGRKLHQLGFRIQVSRNPIRQHLGHFTFKDFWSRQIRWGRLRKVQTPFGFLAEPLFNSVLSGAMGAFAFAKYFHVSPLLFLSMHFAAWLIGDCVLTSKVAGMPKLKFVSTWFLRELIHLPLWIHIGLGNSIVWRGQIIRLKKPIFPRMPSVVLHDLQEFLRNPDFFPTNLADEVEKMA
jgi:ceramide glucosyltransferase